MNFEECNDEPKPEDEASKYNEPFPDYKSELDNAKNFLQKCSPYTGDNL